MLTPFKYKQQYTFAVHPYEPSVLSIPEVHEEIEKYKAHLEEKSDRYEELYKLFVDAMEEYEKMKKELNTDLLLHLKKDITQDIFDLKRCNTHNIITSTAQNLEFNEQVLNILQLINEQNNLLYTNFHSLTEAIVQAIKQLDIKIEANEFNKAVLNIEPFIDIIDTTTMKDKKSKPPSLLSHMKRPPLQEF